MKIVSLVIGVALIGMSKISISCAATSKEVTKYNWTLEDVIKIALENNPDLKSAKANYLAASKGVGIAVSGYLPHVDIYSKFEQTSLPNPNAGATAQLGVSLPYQMITASLSQTIFDFGKVLGRISSSRAKNNASEQEAISVRNAVELAVQRAFYDVESTEQLIQVAKKGLGKYNETLRRTQVLVKTGTKPSFDLSQARVEAAKAELIVINAQNSYDYAQIALLNLMGIQEQISFTLIDQGTPKEFLGVSSDKLILDKLIEEALVYRPEMKKQQFSLESVRSELSTEIKNYFPTFSLQAWAGKFLPNYPPPISDTWGVAVVGTWHIFEGLETTFRAGEISARVVSQEAMVDKDRLAILSEVTRSYKDLIRSENNLKVAIDALDNSKENLRLAEKRYASNIATILELLTAENALLNFEASSVTARFDHEIALATLRRMVNAPLKD